MSKKIELAENKSLWQQFTLDAALTSEQEKAFKRYALLLLAWNKRVNLTAITTEQGVINYHFKDSLKIEDIVGIRRIAQCVDIGSGGGFPGIPLAIKYPHLKVILIEVNAKKIQFLDHVIAELKLAERVAIFDEDWRTFLRTTKYDAQLFCARASVKTEELIRMFKPASPYKNARLVYWASEKWEPSAAIAPYIADEYGYQVGNKRRRIVVMER